MKYVDGFRDAALGQSLLQAIKREIDPQRSYRLMEFCGGHTHAIFRHGLQQLLPENVRFIHGPGCPVCVLPKARVDDAIAMLEQHSVTLCTYGDVMRVPASDGMSLAKAKAMGADVRMVYSVHDALDIARQSPTTQVVFFALGFETTTPPTAVAILQAQREGLQNFSVHCNHVCTIPAMQHVLADDDVALDGVLGPSHVSTIIGAEAYADTVARFAMPLVITGFEPLDVLQAVRMLVAQIHAGAAKVENEYTRAVLAEGNRKAQALMERVFAAREQFAWRGLGYIPNSAYRVRDAFANYDAELRFPVHDVRHDADPRGCLCPEVLRGVKNPKHCPLFGTVCTPENPLGACMVSSEGACAAYWHYAPQDVSHAD